MYCVTPGGITVRLLQVVDARCTRALLEDVACVPIPVALAVPIHRTCKSFTSHLTQMKARLLRAMKQQRHQLTWLLFCQSVSNRAHETPKMIKQEPICVLFTRRNMGSSKPISILDQPKERVIKQISAHQPHI